MAEELTGIMRATWHFAIGWRRGVESFNLDRLDWIQQLTIDDASDREETTAEGLDTTTHGRNLTGLELQLASSTQVSQERGELT